MNRVTVFVNSSSVYPKKFLLRQPVMGETPPIFIEFVVSLGPHPNRNLRGPLSLSR